MRCRDNVLLLGDSLGDLNMAKGLSAEEVLTVGFLNDKVRDTYETAVSCSSRIFFFLRSCFFFFSSPPCIQQNSSMMYIYLDDGNGDDCASKKKTKKTINQFSETSTFLCASIE